MKLIVEYEFHEITALHETSPSVQNDNNIASLVL